MDLPARRARGVGFLSSIGDDAAVPLDAAIVTDRYLAPYSDRQARRGEAPNRLLDELSEPRVPRLLTPHPHGTPPTSPGRAALVHRPRTARSPRQWIYLLRQIDAALGRDLYRPRVRGSRESPGSPLRGFKRRAGRAGTCARHDAADDEKERRHRRKKLRSRSSRTHRPDVRRPAEMSHLYLDQGLSRFLPAGRDIEVYDDPSINVSASFSADGCPECAGTLKRGLRRVETALTPELKTANPA
jgi:hypothetical protein